MHQNLPPDHFGVFVENEMDARRLVWLANEIGERKLRASVAKYQSRYPGSQPFVSRLLTWHGKKVPVAVYAPVRVPVCSVYLLAMTDGIAMKIGFSGCWHQRPYSFLKSGRVLTDLFDVDRSYAVVMGASRKSAFAVESEMKHRFSSFSVASPWERQLIPFGCGGHKEWFSQACYQAAVSWLQEQAPLFPGAQVQSLRRALELHAIAESCFSGPCSEFG